MKRQSKKEKEATDKFKKDTKGMSHEQVMEYYKLDGIEKEKFVQKFREDRDKKLGIKTDKKEKKKIENKVDSSNDSLDSKSSKSKSPRSSLTKKEREKGFRAERIWHVGNEAISIECQRSNNVRNTAQYFERANYFKNRDLLREKRKAGDSTFKINKKDRYIYHNELDKMKDKVEFEVNDNGKEIDKYKKFKDAYYSMSMACLSQQTLLLVADSWDGYFEGLFGYLAGDPNYTGMPKIPGYGDQGGEYVVVIPNDKFRIISGQDIADSWDFGNDINKKVKNVNIKNVNTLAFEPGLHYLKLDGLKTTLTDKDDIRELRIVPAGVGYFIEIIYKLKDDQIKKELLKDTQLNPNIVGGIDLGLRNIVTKGFVEIINDNNDNNDNNRDKSGKVIGQPINFKGGILKSINQYYNKRRAEIQSTYEHQAWKLKRKLRHLNFQYNVKTKNATKKEILFKEIQKVKGELKKIRTGPALRKLTFKRNNKMEDVMHKYSRYIINDNIDKKSGTLIVGHNKGQKQSIELGKITNQNFVFIPFYKLIKMIEYKGEEVGIKVIIREESHTSKCSVIDWEDVKHKEKGQYLGKRYGGLFKSKNGTIINSDVQGYLNIIRKEIEENKVFPDIVKIDGIEGVGLHPVRVFRMNEDPDSGIRKAFTRILHQHGLHWDECRCKKNRCDMEE